MAEDPRCDFLALAPRPQKTIIDVLSIPQIYCISMKSKRWQRIVKETNTLLDRLEVEFGIIEESLSDEIYVKVEKDNEEVLKICIPNFPDSKYHMERPDDLTVMDYAKCLDSETARTDHLSIVGGRLLTMFKFKKRGITISSGPNFLRNIWCSFLQKNFQNLDRLHIKSDSIPLPQEHFLFVLQHFNGEDIITSDMEHVEEIIQEINFEQLVLNTINWLSKGMVQRLNARRVEINAHRNCGFPLTIVYICSLIQSWIKGKLSNLRYFQCRLYWKQGDVDLLCNYLKKVSYKGFRPIRNEENENKNFLVIVREDICNENGVYAYARLDSLFKHDLQMFKLEIYETKLATPEKKL